MSRPDPSPLPTSSSAEELSAGEAEILARVWHGAETDAQGVPYLAHVARVAAASPADARAVAWLHDALERTDLREEDLLLAGLSDDQLRALRLLTRYTPAGHDEAYLAHVGFIARAAGRAGSMARSVKQADLRDHITHKRQFAIAGRRHTGARWLCWTRAGTFAVHEPRYGRESCARQAIRGPSHGRERLPRHGSHRCEHRVSEAAARSVVETAAKTVRDLRAAEVVRQDLTIEDGGVVNFRVRMGISFKYGSGD